MAEALWAQCLDKAARNDPHDHDAPIQQQARHLPSVRIKNEPAFQTTAHPATPTACENTTPKPAFLHLFYLYPGINPKNLEERQVIDPFILVFIQFFGNLM